MDDFKKYFPRYTDDADYTTNAPSYYDDLARKNKLIQLLAKKIWEYEDRLNMSLAEVKEVLARVLDVIGEGFNEEIKILLVKWIEDGTLDHIINETLMNQKADKVDLQALETLLLEKMETLKTELQNQMVGLTVSTNTKITKLETDTTTKLNELDNKIKQDITEIVNTTVYNNGISYTKYFHAESETVYYLTRIPRKDPLTGKVLKLKQYTDLTNPQIVEEFAKELDSDFVINAGWADDTGLLDYVWIENGEIRNNKPSSAPSRYTLGIKEDGTLKAYHNVNATELIRDGVVDAHTAFVPVILNGQKNTSVFNASTGLGEQHPRQVIGQYKDKSLLILTTDGRGYNGWGLNTAQCADILWREGVDFAYMTDGGGSTQTVVRHQMINTNTNNTWVIDDYRRGRGNYKRPRLSVLYLEKPSEQIKDKAVKQVSQDLGKLKDSFDIFTKSNEVDWEPYIFPINGDMEQVTYDVQQGTAIRIGNMVFAFYHLKGKRTGSQYGNLRMGKLPYYPQSLKNMIGIVQEFDGLANKSSNKQVDPYFELLDTESKLYVQGQARDLTTGELVNIKMEGLDTFNLKGVFIYPISVEHYIS